MGARRILCFTWLTFSSCITVTTVNIGTKTSLENQLMGTFEPLNEAEMLAASVRAANRGTHLIAANDPQSRAIAARRRQLFNRDDLHELKAAGCLGEALEAVLVSRDCPTAASRQALLQRMLKEENADRQDVIAWALTTDSGLAAKNPAEITGVYHRLLVEQANPGEWVQSVDGTWSQR